MTISLLVGGTSENTFTAASIKSISLQQDAGIINDVLPIDVLTVEVLATNISLYNNWVELTVNGTLWCVYWLTDLRKTGTNTYKVVAKSPVFLLDSIMVDPTMYSNDSAYTVLNALLSGQIPLVTLDSSLSSLTISGYCPRQTLRERVQWILMSLSGLYRLRSSFVRGVAVELTSGSGGTIPASFVYYAPSLTQEQWVTHFRTYYHQYTPIPSPSGYTDVVQVGSNYYQHTALSLLTSNPRPEAAASVYNEFGVNSNTLITVSNVYNVSSILSGHYFAYASTWRGRMRWIPGMVVGTPYTIPVTATTTAYGYLRSAKYIFGSQGIAVDAEFTCQR